jgi:mannose-6-phosphate isomerase-like protein (cupin superfamily)
MVIALDREFSKLTFIGDRTPESTNEELVGAFAELTLFRDGAIYIGHYAGNSKWERHSQGDEIVYVLEGRTTLILLVGDGEDSNELHAGQLLVVPKNTWHRFETPEGVKILAVTPQPTEHKMDHPFA